MKVLLTNANTSIGSHVLHELSRQGHETVFASPTPKSTSSTLRLYKKFVTSTSNNTPPPKPITIANPTHKGAFDAALKATSPPFDAIIHIHPPFRASPTDPEKDVLVPAIDGTTSLLTSIRTHAPQVKRVVLLSSTAAIINAAAHRENYDEFSWNPITYEQGLEPGLAYVAGVTLAEKSAWMFMRKKGPGFALTTICAAPGFGPVVHVDELGDGFGTVGGGGWSREGEILALMDGKYKNAAMPDGGPYLWADVRDVATAVVRALESGDAVNQRVLVAEGYWDSGGVVRALREVEGGKFAGVVPGEDVVGGGGGGIGEGVFGFDNGKSRRVLGLEYRGLGESVRDTVESILALRG
ncbi:NAD(P)-binding protein [Aspergillus ellipticus CBS 707.79]|uniref:NAD(P)-binding protein n=1 Tax=Aspergillus ellipticus CBS 707.79 TaxID=1448320 RepID=A0A319CZ64_9EURO|nr:NAD(P)-binding protein [Aspergillus ellipticus CBS 707.79]